MQNFLNNFKLLSEEDWTWLVDEADKRNLLSSEKLLIGGKPSDELYILLEGRAGVFIRHPDGSKDQVGIHGAGAIIGLSSWLKQTSPAASVEALEASNLLALSKRKLEDKLEHDTGFASRFMRSAANYLASRLSYSIRETANLKFLTRDGAYNLDTRVPELNARLSAMKALFLDLDKVAMENFGELTEPLQAQTVAVFGEFCHYLNTLIGDRSSYSESVRSAIGKTVQKEILPFLAMTNTADRFYSKPRGYAGDYLTIAQIYEDKPAGAGRIGALVDKCFLNEPAAKAVKNRRSLLKRIIKDTLQCQSASNVLSLASGPAAEIIDVYQELDNKQLLNTFLVDIDMQALAYVSEKRDKLGLQKQMSLFNSNIVYLATGKQELAIPQQDLIYSIGLIDYFADEFVVLLLDKAFEWLKPGGKVVLGNFHPLNPDKAFMDFILEWNLIHRAEEDINRLFRASKFASDATMIEFEPTGVNMFAHCVKAY